jgi:hypothetical protein
MSINDNINAILENIDAFDGTPFGKTGKLLDVMQGNANRIQSGVEKLIRALDGLVLVCGRTGDSFQDFEEQAEVYNRETGGMRPGKDVSAASGDVSDVETRRLKYAAWVQSKIEAGRSALRAI